jgi:hypothetical protein
MQASSIGTLTKLLKNAREQRILDNFKKKKDQIIYFLKFKPSFFFKKENSINYIILILFEIIYFYKKKHFHKFITSLNLIK